MDRISGLSGYPYPARDEHQKFYLYSTLPCITTAILGYQERIIDCQHSMEHVRTPAGHKTPTQAVGFDASDASGGSPKQPSTPIRAGKKRARATSPTPSHRGLCDSGPTEGVPQWITGSAPFRTSGATKPAGSQLGTNIRTAYEAKAKRLSEAGQALAEMGDYISHKIDEWKKAGLSEALGLATDINNVVQNYCANLGKGSDSGNSSYGPNNSKSN